MVGASPAGGGLAPTTATTRAGEGALRPGEAAGVPRSFAGSGAIPLEALASDLNPVAVLINKAMIEMPPSRDHPREETSRRRAPRIPGAFR